MHSLLSLEPLLATCRFVVTDGSDLRQRHGLLWLPLEGLEGATPMHVCAMAGRLAKVDKGRSGGAGYSAGD